MVPRARAFTLIELLIVVAIIAILAAIAVPNFLEAQTRAKVSRVKNDLRAYGTAMEAYHIDNNCYPVNVPGDPDFDTPLLRLSTPVAYLTSGWLEDPFGNSEFLGSGGEAHYFYTPLNDCDPFVKLGLDNDLIARLDEALDLRWMILSAGPDRIYQYQICIELGNDVLTCLSEGNEGYLEGRNLYDPTNGTISFGDIRRSGHGLQTGPHSPAP
jgi:prepilin-type N-terminal cleavage/methylation domain-containing protein